MVRDEDSGEAMTRNNVETAFDNKQMPKDKYNGGHYKVVCVQYITVYGTDEMEDADEAESRASTAAAEGSTEGDWYVENVEYIPHPSEKKKSRAVPKKKAKKKARKVGK